MFNNGFIVRVDHGFNNEASREVWSVDKNDFIATAFQTRDFLENFYTLMPSNCSALTVSVTDAASGRLAMVFFFLLRQDGQMTYIEAPDLDLMDYFAPSVAQWFNPDSAQMNSIWTLILAALPDADALSLKKIPELLPDGRPNPLLLLSGTVPMGTGTKVIPLKASAGEGDYTRAGIYKDAKRLFRRIGKEGEVTFRVASTQEEASELFDHLLAQRIPRFQALNRPDPLINPWVKNFYRQRAVEGAVAGSVHLSGLFVDDECVATDLSFVQHNRYTRILTAIAQNELERFSPGFVLFALVLDDARERGAEFYDLGVGEIPYKTRFPGPTSEIHEHHAAFSVRGRIVVLKAQARRMMRHGVKRYPQLRTPVEKLRTRLQRLKG